MNIKKWYTAAYQSDVLGYELNEDATFSDLYTGILHGDDIYNFIGVNDSLMRERIFLKLSNILSVDYGTIYEIWINNIK